MTLSDSRLHSFKATDNAMITREVTNPKTGENAIAQLRAGLPIRLIESKTGKENPRLCRSGFLLRLFCFSPDGKLAAGCGANGIKIWHAATGTLLCELGGHRGLVTAVAFSSDGSTLATGGLRLAQSWFWDLAKLVK